MSLRDDLETVLADADVVVKEWQATTECEVCCNTVFSEEFEFVKFSDPETWLVDLQHGKGCYVINEDGGGNSYFDIPREVAIAIELKRIAALVRDLLPGEDVVAAIRRLTTNHRYPNPFTDICIGGDPSWNEPTRDHDIALVLPTLARLAEGNDG